MFLPPANEVCKCYVLHVSVILSTRGGGVVSQHALQVSRLAGAGGVSRPTPKREVQGIWPGGVSSPTPKGEVEGGLARCPGPHLGGGVYPSMD